MKYEGLWYHEIDFGDEKTIPIMDIRDQWEQNRKVRSLIDYKEKRVVDVASFDGMWAFEAERLGASLVVAIDSIDFGHPCEFISKAMHKMLYARERLKSNVIPHYTMSVHEMSRLPRIHGGQFDIVQHMGLLYHLENPWHSLKQARRALKLGGQLLCETAVSSDAGASMRMNRGSSLFYKTDPGTYWAPTMECLSEMLMGSGFCVDETSILSKEAVTRACVLATAVETDEEFNNDYRCGIA